MSDPGVVEPLLRGSFGSAPETPGLVRKGLEPFRRRMAPRAFDALLLLATEVVTNAIRHGARGQPIRVLAGVVDGAVRFEVRNVPGVVRPRMRDTSKRDLGGLGLRLVDRVARRWGHRNGGETLVWFELPVR